MNSVKMLYKQSDSILLLVYISYVGTRLQLIYLKYKWFTKNHFFCVWYAFICSKYTMVNFVAPFSYTL